MHKISVIIPVYNVESYISKCLDTVINQVYCNLEIIIVNDGSTDNSSKVISGFAEKDSRIKVLNQENKGVSAARNLGLNNATGDLIGFVDPDDWIDLKMYKVLTDLMLQYEADVSSCHLRGCVSRDYVEVPRDDIKIEVFNHIETLEKFLNSEYAFNGLNSVVYNRIYKKEIFRNLRFNENLIKGEDTELTHKLFFDSKKLVYTDERLYFYFRRDDGLSHSEISAIEKLNVDFIMLEMFVNKIQKTKGILLYENIFKQSISNLLSYNIELYYNHTDLECKRHLKTKYSENYLNLMWLALKYLTLGRNLRFFLFLLSPKVYKKLI
ncbi:glycosyltransferase [Flavobacterium sp. F-380]|uniref:Glycosyltransferase n=1 Tax=Flavobacterium kayseriense TaxID=2764714 RepID=A0ABR7J7J4_9FLAO|nr:glycosyltransferase [Flavobacterium kayseriense]MBC5841471.1 glycosyltransferase [Flavobacterium kayseriense]MBC5847999.1 glycosyltransferase [Flavobacterium kayseriense]